MLDEVFEELKANFDSTLKAYRQTLAKVRTGRANLSMLDGLKVEYYGTPTPLNQVGTCKVADARLITIQPWEKSMLGPIEKAIHMSDLGLNPSNDGTIIRLPVPELTGERRQDLVKQVRRAAEDHKIIIRNHRRDANDMIKELEKDSEISEDEMHRALKSVQESTDQTIARVETFTEEKEKEILEI
ncbi:MAG: ribosome recycling factor [Myxococcales bacterium]|nr:ribosome recycling factor [Myxococcales bacterium]